MVVPSDEPGQSEQNERSEGRNMEMDVSQTTAYGLIHMYINLSAQTDNTRTDEYRRKYLTTAIWVTRQKATRGYSENEVTKCSA